MDRDKRWERIKVAYDAMVHRQGEVSTNIFSAISESYEKDITDEFLLPIINAEAPDARIMDGDAVICFNFRTDRCREIT